MGFYSSIWLARLKSMRESIELKDYAWLNESTERPTDEATTELNVGWSHLQPQPPRSDLHPLIQSLSAPAMAINLDLCLANSIFIAVYYADISHVPLNSRLWSLLVHMVHGYYYTMF